MIQTLTKTEKSLISASWHIVKWNDVIVMYTSLTDDATMM